MSFYRETYGHREGEFPVCEDVAARSVALPFFPAMERRAGRSRRAPSCVAVPLGRSAALAIIRSMAGPGARTLTCARNAGAASCRCGASASYAGAATRAASEPSGSLPRCCCRCCSGANDRRHRVGVPVRRQLPRHRLEPVGADGPRSGLLRLRGDGGPPLARPAASTPPAVARGSGGASRSTCSASGWRRRSPRSPTAQRVLASARPWAASQNRKPRAFRSSTRRWASTGACGRSTSRSRARTSACSPRRRSSTTPTATRSSRGLDAVEAELRDGTFPFADDDEDIHMAIERRVTELTGPAGGKIHTARSRNDQVVTDLAMFVRSAARDLEDARDGAHAHRSSPVAEAHIDAPLPGYTHLQRAQPIYLSHHLLAYAWMLRARSRPACTPRPRPRRCCRSARARWPASTSTPTAAGRRRARLRRRRAELGRRGLQPRLRLRPAARLLGLRHASLAPRPGDRAVDQQRVRASWCSATRGRSGSSIMPQKKNPDCGELLRGKQPRVVAHMTALHGVVHALPLDLQQGPPGGQGARLRRRRHACACRSSPPRGCSPVRPSTASAWPRPPATS